MKLQFYYKTTHKQYEYDDSDLFVDKNGNVWTDNGDSSESQCSVINLYDFLIPLPELYAKVVGD